MRFLADMGVSMRVVEHLRTLGHDIFHLREHLLHRMPDGDIFQLAYAENRIVLTFDLDFGEILARSAGKIVSVVLFRLHDTRTDTVINRLMKALADAQPNLEQGAIVVVEDGRHRIRHLPIGSS